ncbi:nuclease-related domain-containing protein [Bacillus sp. FJAT-52991]|uniref:Nuclease-related domain-containing protein n=1 Tax=Bacillus kandeliae TaxID=3129297 RepID=A0ABZ2N5N0_9BACI
MLVKERTIPLTISILEALARNLPEHHAKQLIIEDELAKSRAGHRGEQSIDYHLSFFPDDHLILHNVRLASGDHFFQIDTLIICPNMIVILEVKNIAGTLFFDEAFHQLIRTIEEKEEAFPDPILQVWRQQRQLESWLTSHKFPTIPIVPFVVISNPSTIIKNDPTHKIVRQTVIHASVIPFKFDRLHQMYKNQLLSLKETKKMSRLLIKHHQPYRPDLLRQLQISEKELLTGAKCEKCQHQPMQRNIGKWHCSRCNHYSIDAHIPALTDYALLHSPTITNKQFRDYFQIQSSAVAKRLLGAMNLEQSGNRRNRIYHLS